MSIRPLTSGDRERVQALLLDTGAFQPHEMAVAMELIDIVLTKPDQQDYHAYVLEHEGEILAYACFGQNPMTRYTYDLYWIATRASHGRRGHGREIYEFVETRIRQRGGRQVMIETSSKSGYEGSHIFYQRIGCSLAARLPNFYDDGDDMLIYWKRLEERQSA
jgi:ribosomal protein S18 acetylase RimI-like enzyme